MALDALAPRDEADLAELVAGANGPLAIVGGGTQSVEPLAGQPVSMRALSGVSRYEAGAMTLVAGSGTSLAEIEAVLAAEHQRLAFEPMDWRALLGTEGVPSLGGAYAANLSGPRRIQVGAARDFALGVRFVDGQGRVVKNGGRVMKNVTGYDLVKMLAGSRGRLGVVTEVSLKTQPCPEMAVTLRVEVNDLTAGVACLAAALGSPYDVSGAAMWHGAAHLRVEGFEASVTYRRDALQDLLRDFGPISLIEGADIWRDIRDVTCFAGQDGDVWRISVKPSDGPQVVSRLPGEAMLDWGGGLVWALVPGGFDVRQALDGIPGHATCVRGAGQGPRYAPAAPDVQALLDGVKAEFDPRNILNPGQVH